jgi:hypothetical protein
LRAGLRRNDDAIMHEHPLDPTEAFAALGRIKLSDTDLRGVLNTISELAQRAIAGAEEVSVTLVRGDGAYTATFTGDIALALDEWQYDQGRGPCLDAAQAAAVVSVPDTGSDDRWTDWGPGPALSGYTALCRSACPSRKQSSAP